MLKLILDLCVIKKRLAARCILNHLEDLYLHLDEFL